MPPQHLGRRKFACRQVGPLRGTRATRLPKTPKLRSHTALLGPDGQATGGQPTWLRVLDMSQKPMSIVHTSNTITKGLEIGQNIG